MNEDEEEDMDRKHKDDDEESDNRRTRGRGRGKGRGRGGRKTTRAKTAEHELETLPAKKARTEEAVEMPAHPLPSDLDKAAHKASELVKQDIKDAALAKEDPERTEDKGRKPPKGPKKKATPKKKVRTATKKSTPKKNKPAKPTVAPETEAKDDSSGAAVEKKEWR